MSIRPKYRWLTGAVLLLALLLTLLPAHDKRRLGMPEPWSYELAAEQIAQGNWYLDDAQMTAARTQVHLAGAQLTQYVPVAPDRWALRQSPGHTLEMALLVLLGAPRLTNTALALLAVLALYPALAAWHDERAAFLGVTLFLLSPMSLLALHYSSMDTFSGGVWPLIAGALLLWYAVSSENVPRQTWVLLPAGFATGWATVVRQTNVLLSVVLAAGALAFAINGVVSVVIAMLLGPQIMATTLAAGGFTEPLDTGAVSTFLLAGTLLLQCAGVVLYAVASAAGGAAGAALLGSQPAGSGAPGARIAG